MTHSEDIERLLNLTEMDIDFIYEGLEEGTSKAVVDAFDTVHGRIDLFRASHGIPPRPDAPQKAEITNEWYQMAPKPQIYEPSAGEFLDAILRDR